MIIKEFYKTRNDGVNLYRTYSDEGFMIQKVGTEFVYAQAIDVESATYEYVETFQLVPDKSSRKVTSKEFDRMLEEIL